MYANPLEPAAWPVDRLGDALVALARVRRLPIHADDVVRPPQDLLSASPLPLERWLEGAAESLGLEAELIEAKVRELPRLIAHCAPALIRLHSKGSSFLAVVRGRRGAVTLLGPDLRLWTEPVERVCSALLEFETAPLAPMAERVSARVNADKQRIHAAITAEVLRATWIRRCWHLRLPPTRGFVERLRAERGGRRIGVFALAHVLGYALVLAAFATIGRAVFRDELESGWISVWLLLLLTWLPLRIASTWQGGVFALALGRMLKQRLLADALLLDPDELRRRGVGQLLAPVLEAEELESSATQGGLLALSAMLDLAVTAVLLGYAAGAQAALVLLGALALGAYFAARYVRARTRWTEQRLSMTHDLIERILGHRTRLCQEAQEQWHDTEDQQLARYLDRCRELDRAAGLVGAALGRGYAIAALVTLAPTFVRGSADLANLSLVLFAILISQRALNTLASSTVQLCAALVSLRQLRILSRATAGLLPSTASALGRPQAEPVTGEALLEGENLGYRHKERAEAVLDRCSVRIARGDCLLLEGPSGSGKSTLLALLAGLRTPQDGIVLAGGLDRQTLGTEGWRRRIAAAPQFHENHVLTGTVAFNLLMGRSWPPRPGDLDEAEAVCRELGLGELLERMPGGMQQALGETGWRLSHGERSRIFIARTLLQGADVVLLDESFAALDPETLERVGRCVLTRAPALLVIAHP